MPKARYGGDHVEVDKARQVLFLVRGGKVALVTHVSTGATGNTPLGLWHVYAKVARLELGALVPELLPARLRDPRLSGRAAVPRLAWLRADPDVARAEIYPQIPGGAIYIYT